MRSSRLHTGWASSSLTLFINIENSDKSNPDNIKWYSRASCYTLPFHQNPCPGDRQSDGAEDEQASFKQNEHAKGDPAYEQAETSQHSEVSFSSSKQSDLLIFCPDMRLCAFTRVNFMPSLNILRCGDLKKKTSKEGAIYIRVFHITHFFELSYTLLTTHAHGL